MDKEQRTEGATILRFPVCDAGRLAQRLKAAAVARVPPPDNGFDIDAWYHQSALDDVVDPAKH